VIRKATSGDIGAIVEMGLEFWKHSPIDVPADPDSIEAFAEHCLSEGLLCVLEVEGGIEGFAAGIKGYVMANLNHTMGNEVALWVNKSHRAGRNGYSLIKFLEGLAREAGIEFWSMSYMETSMPEEVCRLYEGMGYTRSEVQFTKRLF
jgi:GNAT superfamily N-acetyltransferase